MVLRRLWVALLAAAVAAAASSAEARAAALSDASAKPLVKTWGDDRACTSPIYCQGELLHVVQIAELYRDSKTFVDMRLRRSADETLRNFERMMQTLQYRPSRDDLKNFVEKHFETGDELQHANLSDWVEKPPTLSKIYDPKLRGWAYDLNRRWKDLSKKVPDYVKEDANRTSLLYVPYQFVVPGGRFKEMYYWDSYWIIRGLLTCNMNNTVRGILENLLYLLRHNGIIPNASRIYYTQRSQPPLLIPMVDEYIKVTRDTGFLRENIDLLEQEFQFWINKRIVELRNNGKTYILARYTSHTKGPRPESYREDYNLAKQFPSEGERQEFYFDIRSAAESGWDFSSRWFIKNGTNDGNLMDINTKNIIPVDLNAIICGNAKLLSTFYSILNDTEKANYYLDIGKKWQEAIADVLWNEKEGSWFDYDILNRKQRTHFYGSNMAPLWTMCYDENKVSDIAEKVVQYLNRMQPHDYVGGIPGSLQNSGEQWDFPNAWPPIQHIIIEGLERTSEPTAQKLAFDLAKNWISSNYKTFVDRGHMYEKNFQYDATSIGKYGGGGEYTVQSGFGWTNGIILVLLDKYGQELTSENLRNV